MIPQKKILRVLRILLLAAVAISAALLWNRTGGGLMAELEMVS